MHLKISSFVAFLVICFIVKVSFETAMAEKVPHDSAERIPASIDKNYREYMGQYNRR